MMYVPKKQNWNSLNDLRDFLVKETAEKIVLFNGYQLVTETTIYGLAFGKLSINEVKSESKSTKRRSDGSTADKERMGTHGRSDHVEPDRKKASKVCATKVPKKVSKSKKTPK